MNPKTVIGDNYKEVYKKQHQTKHLTNDSEAKTRFNIFKVNPIFKYEDKKHFQDLYTFDVASLDQYSLPEDKKELNQNISRKKEKKIKKTKNNNIDLEGWKDDGVSNAEEQVLEKKNNEFMKYGKEKEAIKNKKDNRHQEVDQELDEENIEIIDQLIKDNSMASEEENLKALKDIFKKIFDSTLQRNQEKEHEEELYVKKNSKTQRILDEIDNGEKAVQFFAMYGNTTPIKFIFCVKKRQNNRYNFRPYDLKVVKSVKMEDDYFIITPYGITHVYKSENLESLKNPNGTERNINKVAEFYSLSDWMYQSTLFNILKRINYYKNYLPFKIFTIWRNFNRFNKYLRIRQQLGSKLFLAKPAYVNSLIRTNGQVNQLIKIPLHDVSHETWSKLGEFDEFHKPLLENAKLSIRKVIESDIFDTLKNLYSHISNRLKENKEIDENENSKTLQEIKNKSMFKLKLEKQMRKKLINMAKTDLDSYERFIILVDLMCVEMLYQLKKVNLKNIKNEIYKIRTESNNTGIFTLTVSFPDGIVNLNPTDSDIEDHFKGLFRMMIDIITETARFISIFSKKEYDQVFNLGEYSSNLAGNALTIEKLSELERTQIKTNDSFDEYLKSTFKNIIETSKFFRLFTETIFSKIFKSYKFCVENIASRLEPYIPLQKDIENWGVEEFVAEKPKIEAVRNKLDEIRKWSMKLDELINTITLENIMNNDMTTLKDNFKNFLNKSKEVLDKYVKEKFIACKKKIVEDVRQFDSIKLTKKNNIAAACEYKLALNKYQTTLKKLEERINKFNDIYNLVKVFKVETVTLDLLQEYDINKNQFIDIEQKVKNGYEEINKLKDNFLVQLENEVKVNQEKIRELNEEITDGVYLEVHSNRDEIRDNLSNMSQALQQCEQKCRDNFKHRNILDNIPLDTSFKDPELEKLKYAFDLRNRLWQNLIELENDTINWKKLSINELRNAKIEDKIREYKSVGLELSQKLSEGIGDKVCEFFLEKTRVMELSSPIIIALSSQSMQDRHWKEIFEYLKIKFVPKLLDEISLGDLLDKYNISTFAESIDVISAAAIAQEKIQKDLEKIEKDWSNTKFIVQGHNKSKDKFIIASVEDIMNLIDEHSQLIQSALNSRHVAEIRKEVQEWDDTLNLIIRVIEEWLMVQKHWIYLENIFSADDIKRQLPDAHKNFTKVNKGFKDLMFKTQQNPLTRDRCKEDGVLDMLIRFNKELDQIQKSLEDYLQTKRKAFPRFYFLSNDELLKILSQTRNPRAVQDYLNKCFDGIKTINFINLSSNEIIEMVSPENEVIKLSKTLFAHENIEGWLLDLENIMFQSVYDECKNCLENYPYYGESRKGWIYSGFACQAVITIDQVMWANYVEKQFEKISFGDVDAVKEYSKFLESQIFELAEMVRDKVGELKKSLVERLIIINVHARDVVRDLIKQDVTEKTNFEWQKNLKFYWEEDKESEKSEVVIKQTNSRFIYGYEYLGNPERMVITPLTDKCYITLTSALHLNFGGAPAGPAGTGKTETTKDLSKALAIKINVFNCSDQLDFKTMGRMFCGLAECGAWACFDEFNRIDLEVLSVIAQQIETIQTAIREKKTELLFEGNMIGVKNRFGVFITMNPGYAGRSELPDNLKSLFRPVAMMIPDYALVSEVTLFSKGFKEAKELSVKMYQLFKLSSEQLSKQKHYDFGLRGIKSILSRAGYLKEKFSNDPEKIVLIRAMKDSNLPKFLDNDIELFLDIITDLFPRTVVEKSENKIFLNKVKEVLLKENMVAKEKFIEKINQLLDTMMVRLGNMIVGQAGCAKTSLYSTLAKTLTELGKVKDIPEDNWYCPILLNILNPKSVTKNELYMSKDETTQTWEDGIVAKLMRMAEDEEKEEKQLKRRWVVFDGPVDALWIEDMNTVLDDSRKLCLPDSSNIKIPKMMNLIFEVQDLLVASPATVSRCGMVYLEPFHIGYMPIIETWSIVYREKINKIFEDDGSRKQKSLSDVVDRYLKFFDKAAENIKSNTPKLINFIRANCKEKIPSVDINLVHSLLNLVSCFFNPDVIKLQSDHLEELFNYYLSFCFVWSLGANLEDNSRHTFQNVLRDLIYKMGVPTDKSLDLYEIFVNDNHSACTFSKWNEKKEIFKYDKDISFFSILVPTLDTVKYKFLMENLCKNNYNSLFMGETGVGKSVIILDFLNQLDSTQFIYKSSNFSAKTSSKNVYDTLKSTIYKNGNFQPPSGKKFIYFIDDINLPQLDQYGSQQPIEFLRQLIDLKTFYDEKKTQKRIKDVMFMAACAPPSGARNKVSQRLFRHFNMIWMTELSIESMKQIFKSILDGYLDYGSNKSLLEETDVLIDAALEIYNKIRTEKLPTPSKTHYTFNLRDLSKVIQGMLEINLDYYSDKNILFTAWVHETSRQFRDRLLGEDIAWFDNEIGKIYDIKFKSGKLNYSIDKLIFTNVVEKSYKQVVDYSILLKRINETLEKYNVSVKSGNMNLVFFTDAVNHFCRIARIIHQPRGNALLVGLGGSGRQSLTKLVTYSLGYQINSLQIGKGYGVELFWKDLGRILLKSGTSEPNQVFIFSDTQILVESFLEDINNILNNGEVPNLFKDDEITYIFNTLKDSAKSESKDTVYQYFVSNVRERLRVVLCFSPVGDNFRNRCRQFPSIINCATIDWFNRWPDEALVSVANRYLVNLNNQATKEIKDPKEPTVNTNISEEMTNKLQNIFVKVHTKARSLSTKFFEELRRNYYITPTSYLEYIKLFLDIYQDKIQLIPKQILNYKLGIEKLEEANEIVKNLKAELIELEPKQISKKSEVEALIIDLDKNQKIVEVEKSKIQVDKDAVETKRNEILKVKEECDADLSKAKPELDLAKAALGKLNEDDFRVLRSFPKPSDNLIFLAQNVNFIFEAKSNNNDWGEFKGLISEKDFIENCKNTDLLIGKLNDARKLKELAKFYSKIESKDFRTVSSVANGLKIWVGAILKYIECYRIVKPKMDSLDKATKELKIVEDELAEKSKTLNEKLDELNKLTKQFESAKRQLNDLNNSIENINIKSNRAVRLVDGLKSEEKRWRENIIILEKEEQNLMANVIISASIVSYSGPFIIEYRRDFLKSVIQFMKEEGVHYNSADDFSLQNMLSDPLTIREWNYAGLPADDLSIDNAIITVKSKRWPLIIDPQMQANKWIKNFYKNAGIKFYKMSDRNLFNRLKDCISSGWPVLVENVEESIESSLEPILQKNIFRQGAVQMISMGGTEKPIQYSQLFKLFMTSKLANPHYLPEISIKVTLINFTVTLKGLEDQLLVEVVKFERPDLESQKDTLILNINESKKALKDLEQQILLMVRDASSEILENDVLVNKLDQSKEQSIIISADLEKAETTAKKINKERRGYRPIAVRGSIIYFVIASLANVDTMYNYSLEYFLKLFNQRLEKSEISEIVDKRVEILINDITFSFYEKISRGLFEKDKLLYAFLIVINIMLNEEKISVIEWSYFIRGSKVGSINLTEENFKTSKLEPIFSDYKLYKNLVGLKELSMSFYDIENSLANFSDDDLQKLKKFMTSDEPYLVKLPEKFEKILTDFYRLCIVKTLREEKLIFAIKQFIEKNFGKKYLESPPFSISNAYDDSLKITPLIFILSPGTNPVNFLKHFAKDKNIKMTNISLGQGQGIIAKNAILSSKEKGEWVCLENCHLSKSWMPVLEELLEEVNEDESEIHGNYRLWLTSMPTNFFPVSILQSGVKLTNEPPKGIKANLKGTYSNIKLEDFEGSNKPFELQKLTFSLAFFHAIILERRKFGPLGWNIPYEWMNSDFEASKLHLVMYVDEYRVIPYTILQYLIGIINYGGRVTDDKDSKLISALLNQYINEFIMHDSCKYDIKGIYKPPQMRGKIIDCLNEVGEYLETLPLDDNADIFGLHPNANITLQNKMVREFIEPLIAIQPRSSSGNVKKPDDIVLELRENLNYSFSQVKLLDKKKANQESIYDSTGENANLNNTSTKKSPLGNFLLQECDKFNSLISLIKSSLSNLEKAVKGTIVMSPDIEKIYYSFLINQVPKLWEDNAYLSLKPLSSWLTDFIARVNFMNEWLIEGIPKSFWISAFFFPQGFNTAVLQTFARKTSEAIDTLTFRTNILKVRNRQEIHRSPDNGLNIHGLFLQGASWDIESGKLKESNYGELWHEMPCIWLEPCRINQLRKLGYYECPLYKTSRRAGELSTTGHSTNFVMYFYLSTTEDPDHWIRRGTALLTQLDD